VNEEMDAAEPITGIDEQNPEKVHGGWPEDRSWPLKADLPGLAGALSALF